MWELFTGGKTPYPTFSNAQVLQEVSGTFLDIVICLQIEVLL
jgi:hypothetical protein